MLGVNEVRRVCAEALPGAHCHAGEHQLVVITQGESLLCVDGVHYRAVAPCVVFISRLEQHSWHMPGGVYERYTVNFLPDAPVSGEETRLLSVFTHRPPHFCHVLPLEREALPLLLPLLARAARESEREDGGYPRIADDMVRAVLVELMRQAPEQFPEESAGSGAIISQLRRAIEQRLCDELSLRELGQQFHLNPYYLAHRFKAVTGYSIKNYQLRCRVTAVRMLLETTELRMSEICERVGFSDVSSLARYFRREVGMTPTQYRAAARKDGQERGEGERC